MVLLWHATHCLLQNARLIWEPYPLPLVFKYKTRLLNIKQVTVTGNSFKL